MASFRGHLAFAGSLGFVYGGLGANQLGFPAETAVLGAGLMTVGGLLPDLDSDSGVPVREMFGLAGALVPLMLMPRLMNSHFGHEELFGFMAGMYVVIRYGLSRIFKYFTVHRGMWHSIPAMLIASLLFFVSYQNASLATKIYLSAAVGIGFLSHLVLDEIYSVNFEGLSFKLKASAGSAVKMWSKSFIASAICYILLGAMCYWALLEYQNLTGKRIDLRLPTRMTMAP